MRIIVSSLFLLCAPVLRTGGSSGSGISCPSAAAESHGQPPEDRQINDVRELVPGVPTERKLASGAVHAYRIGLVPGQYLHAIVDPISIDLAVTFFEPHGKPLIEIRSEKTNREPTSVSIVAETSGNYRLELRALEKQATPGHYRLVIKELRVAMAQDKSRVAAGTAFAEGEKFRHQGTAESLRTAIGKYEEALRLWRAMGDHAGEAETLNIIGVVHRLLGEHERALEHYHQALRLWPAVGNRRKEATTLHNTGYAYFSMGKYQKALEDYNRGLRLWRAVEDRLGEAYTLHNIGTVYRTLGEHQKALEYYGQALPVLHAMGDRYGEAYTLNSIGLVRSSLGEPRKALEYFSRALPLWQARGDRDGEAYSLHNMGLVYSSLGEPRKALQYYGQALQLRRVVGDRRGEARTLQNVGDLYQSRGENQNALEYYNQALPLWRAVGDRSGEALTLYGMARAERAHRNLTEARAKIENSLTITESLRTEVASEELRASYLASNQSAYEFYVDLLMQLHEHHPTEGHDRAALKVSERARARSLLELLAEAKVDVQQDIAPPLKEREQATQARISSIQSEFIKIHSQSPPDKDKIAVLEAELKKVEHEREQLKLEIRQNHPRYADLRYPTPLGFEPIQSLLDDQAVLLEYFVGKETSFLFAVTNNDFLVARLSSAPALVDRVKKLHAAIARPNWTAFSTYLLQAGRLYQQLIAPAKKLLAGKQELIIVPDGILHYLPFEVLLSGGPRTRQGDLRLLPYLVRDYSIRYVPSASVLASLLRDREPTRNPQKMFLAYADPLYAENEPEEARSIPLAVPSTFGNTKPWKLRKLPQTRKEVEQIAKLYPEGQAALFVGEQATEENVKAEGRLSQYRLIHFAVHGLLNENKPEFSGLIFSLPPVNTEKERAQRNWRPDRKAPAIAGDFSDSSAVPEHFEDGLLQVYEIFKLKLNADLVVLSACETGLGKQVKGEGLIGLTRAFLYAGTPSVVVSLWKAEDRSTADLMVKFYQHMKNQKLSKSQALRRAQLTLLREGKFIHPYYWAPFVLVGKS